jgi:Uma2 family endonuclease
MATALEFITADEFLRMPDNGQPMELERGRIVMMSRPGGRHGWICNRVGRSFGDFADDHDLGFVFNNDSGVVTERDPDSVRGPDVAYFSYARMPKESGPPEGYPAVAPEIIVEVLSPNDRWSTMLRRVSEFLSAGTLVVCVLDPRRRQARLYFADAAEITLAEQDEITFPEILPGFAARVADLLGKA